MPLGAAWLGAGESFTQAPLARAEAAAAWTAAMLSAAARVVVGLGTTVSPSPGAVVTRPMLVSAGCGGGWSGVVARLQANWVVMTSSGPLTAMARTVLIPRRENSPRSMLALPA